MDRVIIVTGACGHLGNTLVKKLLERGETVRGLVRAGSDVRIFEGYGVELYNGDICDYDSLEDIFDVPSGAETIVIHTAGIVSTTSENSDLTRRVNIGGTANIIERCFHHRIKRLIYTSSVHAIEERADGVMVREFESFNPEKVVGVYAKTKAEASQLVVESAEKGMDTVILHPSGIIGPYDYGCGHTTQLIRDYLEDKLWVIVEGGYDFVDVRDVADGIISSIDRGERGGCYILSGRYISVKQLISVLSRITGKKEIKITIPMTIAKITAPLSELYYRIRGQKPMYSIYSLYTLTRNTKFSNEKAERELGFKSRDIEESLRDTVDWIIRKGS